MESMNFAVSYMKRPTATQEGVVGVRIHPTGAVPAPRPVYIALMIDTSGSMKGARINAVKRTLTVLIERLALGDKITLITFANHAIRVLRNFTISVTSRAEAIAKVAGITVEGGTNMQSGLTDLGKCVYNSDKPDAVVILTDGHVNQGVNTVTDLYAIYKYFLKGTPIYTLGYGAEHNGDFLRSLSSMTRGTYTFVNDEMVLPAAIGDLFGELHNMVATGAKLAYPTTWTCEEPEKQTHGVYEIGSLIIDKINWVMFSLPPTANPVDEYVQFTYQVGGEEVRQHSVVQSGLDPVDLEEQLLRCKAAATLDLVSLALKAFDTSRANQLIDGAVLMIASSTAAGRPLAIRIRAQLEEMKETVEDAAAAAETTVYTANPMIPAVLQSNALAANYSSQRGVTNRGYRGNGPATLFSSPHGADEAAAMTTQYSQVVGDPVSL